MDTPGVIEAHFGIQINPVTGQVPTDAKAYWTQVLKLTGAKAYLTQLVEPIPVTIDNKPGNYPNSINLKKVA